MAAVVTGRSRIRQERILIQVTERLENGHLEDEAPGRWVRAGGEAKSTDGCHDYY